MPVSVFVIETPATLTRKLELLRLSADLHNQVIRNVAFFEDDIDSYSALATEVIDGDDS